MRLSSRAEKTRQNFIQAAILEISERGIDLVTVSGIIDRANAARPTFYSNFGSIAGLFADIWLNFGKEFLNEITDYDDGSPSNNYTKTPLFRALIEILSISRRNPELLEVVEPTIKEWWESILNRSEIEQQASIWLFGHRLGLHITLPIDDDAVHSEFIIPLLKSIRNTKLEVLAPTRAQVNELDEGNETTKTPETNLLENTIAVVASTGVSGASLIRIARRSRISTGAIYPNYQNATDLLIASLQYAFPSILESNMKRAKGYRVSPADLGRFVNAAFIDSRQNWRRFRLEMLLAARTNSTIREPYRASLKNTMEELGGYIDTNGFNESLEIGMPYLSHTLGVGLGILHDLGIPIDKIDHRILSENGAKFLTK